MIFKKLQLLVLLESVLVLVFSCTAFGDLVFQEAYDRDLSQFEKHGGCYKYSFAIVQDPCSDNNSNHVVRIINRMGEDNRVCDDWAGNLVTMPGGIKGYKHRAELLPKSKETRADYEKSHWVGERIWIDENWPKRQPANFMTISQIIPVFDGQNGTDMKFYIDNKQRWKLEIRVSAEGKKNFDLGPIVRGKWTNWTFHYNRSKGNKGIAQVWQNGKKVLDYHGPTTYTTESNGMWKHGIYLGVANNKATYTVHFDDLKIAQGANQYDTVQSNKAASECQVSPLPSPPQHLKIQQVETN